MFDRLRVHVLSIGQDNHRLGARITSYNVCYTKLLRNTINDTAFAITIHLKDNIALCIAHPMNDDLLGGLGGNTPEIGNIIHLFTEVVVQFRLGVELAGA